MWPVGLYRVRGESMLPTYQDGNVLIGLRWFTPKIGQVVVAKTADRHVIKRIKRMSPGQVWLEGDNAAASTDSRKHGLYPIEELEAQIIAKLNR